MPSSYCLRSSSIALFPLAALYRDKRADAADQLFDARVDHHVAFLLVLPRPILFGDERFVARPRLFLLRDEQAVVLVSGGRRAWDWTRLL
jgi:hypothetical protein